MDKQKINDFFSENCQQFKQNYSKALKLIDVAAIHDLRVSIKKLNALVKMLNYNKAANFRIKKCYPHLKYIFKTTGSIRDFQVLDELLHNYQSFFNLDNDYLINLAKNDKQQMLKFFISRTKHFDFLEIARLFKIIELYIKSIDVINLNKQISEFRKNHILHLAKFSNPKSKSYDLHAARKIIKDLTYLLDMSEIKDDDYENKLIVYKDASHCIGNWHDRLILENFLKQKIKNLKINNGIIEDLLKQIKEEKSVLREQYFSVLNTFEINI